MLCFSKIGYISVSKEQADGRNKCFAAYIRYVGWRGFGGFSSCSDGW
jgi:hypothetical protein